METSIFHLAHGDTKELQEQIDINKHALAAYKKMGLTEDNPAVIELNKTQSYLIKSMENKKNETTRIQ